MQLFDMTFDLFGVNFHHAARKVTMLEARCSHSARLNIETMSFLTTTIIAGR